MLKRVLFALIVACTGFVHAQTAVNDTVPVFGATTHHGATFQLDSSLTRVTILLFWATWNPPSMELLLELKEQYNYINPIKKGERILNIDIIDACIDTDEKLYLINLKRENLPWNMHLADYKGWESTFLNQLKVSRIPTLIIMDVNRKVIFADPDPKQIRSILSQIKANPRLSN